MKRYFPFLLILFFAYYQAYSQEFAVELKLRTEMISRSSIMVETMEIKTLSTRHGVEMRPSFPNAKNPKLLRYYTLIMNNEYMGVQSTESRIRRESILKEFLATGKFENYVREFEIAYPLSSCVNPISVNDPHFNDEHGWALRMVQAPCAWAITKGSPNILIGIVENHFDTAHEDLRNRFASIHGSFHQPDNAHGTIVASIAAAATNNGLGIAGIGYNSRIAGHLVHQPNPPSFGLRDAIWNLHVMGVPIINVSWTTTGLTREQAQAITENGTTLVLGAGNNHRVILHSSIADVPGVIAVSGVDRNNTHSGTGHWAAIRPGEYEWRYFAHHAWIDISAPGWEVIAARPGNTYAPSNGTSFAAPLVAGTIALMLSVNPYLTPAQIEDIIKATADPIADGHLFPGQLGAGRLNAYRAVRASLPRIDGPTTICATATFTSNFPASSWSITPNSFRVTSYDATSATVVACQTSGQSGVLTAIVNGVAVRKTITACEFNLNTLSISGLSSFSTQTTFSIANLPVGASVHWDSPHANINIFPRTGPSVVASHIPGLPSGPSSISATVSFPRCPGVSRFLIRDIHVGALNSNYISSLNSGNTKSLWQVFEETLLYNSNLATVASRIEWQRFPAGTSFEVDFANPYHFPPGITFEPHKSLQIRNFTPLGNNKQVARINVRMWNHSGWSDWQTLTYFGEMLLQPSPPGDVLIPGPPIDFLGCFCGFVPPGGPRPCPHCEINFEPLFSPNPVSNILTIDLTQAATSTPLSDRGRASETIFDIRLLNSHGMTVRQQRTQARSIQFDVSNLPEGTYYLHIEHGGEIEMHQIIVQRN